MRVTSRLHLASRTLCAAALAIAGAMPAFAQTTITTGNAEVRAFLARNSTNVYAAAYGGGLLFSGNQGASWSRYTLNGSTTDRYLTSLAGNGSFMVVGGDEGLWRSTTGASGSFTKVLYEPIAAVTVGTGASTIVLAAVKGVGILRSGDSGATYALANTTAVDSLDFTSIAADPTNAATFYAAALPDKSGARGGVFRSTDSGSTWSAYNGIPVDANGKNVQVWALTVSSNGTLYAATFNSLGGGDVYYRPPAGSWTATGDFFGGVVSLHTDANTAAQVWGGGRANGLLYGSTTNFNYAFTQNNTPNEFYTGVNAVTTIPGSTAVLQAIKGAGIWRSATAACPCTWTRVPLGTAAASDRVLSAAGLANSTTNFLVGLYAGGVWRTSNGGASFTEPVVNGTTQNDFAFQTGFAQGTNPFVSVWDLAASPTNASLAYATVGGVGMFYSNDSSALFRFDGSHWGAVTNGNGGGPTVGGQPWYAAIETGPPSLQDPTWYQMYGVSMKTGDDTTVFASGLFDNGVYRRNGGASWSQLTLNAANIRYIRDVVVSPSNGNKLLALSFDDKPQISTDGGGSWNPVTISQTGFERIRFYAAAEDPLNGNRWLAATNKGLYFSGDGGFSWSRASMAGVFQQQAVTAVAYKPGTSMAFAADWAGNRYCANNAGPFSLLGTLRAGVNAIRTMGTSVYYLTDGAGIVLEGGSC